MKKFCLVGAFTEKSLSPEIHNWIYRFLNINAEYKNNNIEIANFNMGISNMLSNIKSGLINGINVTNPYKMEILSSDIKLSKQAQKINAVNCVYENNNHLIGDNTDWVGFIESINHNEINLNNYDIRIIGAGGAARAIIYSLQKLGIKRFTIYNRTKITLVINEVEYISSSLEQFEEDLSKNIFLINCIGINMINNILKDKDMNFITSFYDLNYHKAEFHNALREKDIVILG